MVFSPTTLSDFEIDQYSLTRHIQSGLAAAGWTSVTVDQSRDGWPDYEELRVPGVYVLMQTSTPAGYELGSHAKQRTAFIHIFGKNDAQRTRLGESIEDMIRDVVPIFNFVTGNETDPDFLEYFETDEVRLEKIPSLTITPDKEKWRSIVSATLRRVVA